MVFVLDAMELVPQTNELILVFLAEEQDKEKFNNLLEDLLFVKLLLVMFVVEQVKTFLLIWNVKNVVVKS